MLKGLLGFFAFIFFLVVLILLLVGSYLYRTYKKIRIAAQRAADKQAHQYREETGRQRQQYNQRQQSGATRESGNSRESNDSNSSSQFSQPRQTTTATGETIIDNRHQERENKKIFDDSDGEYVDFVEET